MAISGVGSNYNNVYGSTYAMRNNVAMTKSTKDLNSVERLELEKTGGTQKLSEAEEMELFKKEFYEDLSKVTNHRTVSNAAVNISDAAFKAMKDDPQYRGKVLSLIQRDWGDSYAPRNCSVLITVGANLNEYRADSWPVGYDSEFIGRSQNSFYKRTSDKKDRQKELLEENMKKRAQAKMQQERHDEYARLNEEAALKRMLMKQEADERYNKSSIAEEIISIAAYKKNIMEAAGILNLSSIFPDLL